MNLVLVGFMGTGKTEVSKEFARRFGMRYLSIDEMIEEREGMSINDIFKEKGEDHFRAIERDIVKEAASIDGLVIDAGGGVVLDDENMKNLKSSGAVVCLKARPEVILDRMQNKTDRPLLNVRDKLTKINEILTSRKIYYDKIEESIDTSDLTIDEIIEQVRSIFKSSLY
ncbi:MAG: shikimate kinase [Candidatus Kaelpia aquatica]|nr:shikimate kinase [Candidatus Kaelpia aquatica]